MSEWIIDTVINLQSRGILRVEDGNHGESRPRPDEFVDIGVAFIRAADMSDGAVLFDSASKINNRARERITKGIGKPGDIIISHKGTVGRIARVPLDAPEFVCSPQTTFWRSTNEKVLNQDFLYSYMRSPKFAEEFQARSGETDMAGYVSLTSQRSLVLSIPPIELQRPIGALMSTLDDKIRLNGRMNETLEAMARAIFKDWFVDFGPTRAKMEGRASYLAPEIWSLFPDHLDDEGKPEGWNWAPLTHFFEIVGGGTPKTSEPSYWDGHIPWFSVVDTPAGSDTFAFDTEKKISDSGLQNSSARLLDLGDTIISARGTVGNLAMAGRPMAFNQSCYGLKGTNGYGPCFVFLSAKHMVTKLQSLAHGSVFSTITRQTFESVHLPAPGGKIANQFELAASVLFERIRGNVAESRTLAGTRDLLLPKLMSGEVRVKGAEKIVGEAT